MLEVATISTRSGNVVRGRSYMPPSARESAFTRVGCASNAPSSKIHEHERDDAREVPPQIAALTRAKREEANKQRQRQVRRRTKNERGRLGRRKHPPCRQPLEPSRPAHARDVDGLRDAHSRGLARGAWAEQLPRDAAGTPNHRSLYRTRNWPDPPSWSNPPSKLNPTTSRPSAIRTSVDIEAAQMWGTPQSPEL